ncbi:hypothetical protein QQS21_001848 [Conoideocrella luteorostrata]|uniref:Uncharacterized protein n=1 Tax=Conoideocrella luteorostrata TaxID=1105319 RepID=A0AAJ0FXU5_9HYPO|nr:hypothetical protein QQS21_001848 [Conoideocrella luteorostrata]
MSLTINPHPFLPHDFTRILTQTTASLPLRVDPKDIPDPTPITLPRYQPLAKDDELADESLSLPLLLRQTGRDSITLGSTGLSAIALDLKLDVGVRDLVPAASCLPNFRQWDTLATESAQNQVDEDRFPLRNGTMSPGHRVYLERRRELANTNENAFRTVRRISAPKGKQQARLGNAYEFFRCLEQFTPFWDDPSQAHQLPPSPELTAAEANFPVDSAPYQASISIRTCSGASMPAEIRQDLLKAFIKLVAYDFGCNVSLARNEPRLQLNSPAGKHQRKSYTPSTCQFVFQSPLTREDARAGVVHGPVATVSTRPTVDFTSPDAQTAQALDLAREVIAALITAQHRNREGRQEVQSGYGQWWTTRHRWGGGVGGPIGREVEKRFATCEKEAFSNKKNDARDGPASKKVRRTMPIYDNYRMVRPSPFSWDRKAKYEAIGRVKDASYDDIFVVSSIFHHVSILRVRVPTRLLEVLDGSSEPDPAKRSWGKVESWRSPWYDFFHVDQRITAMQLLWAVMAYQMRKDTCEQENADGRQ